MCSSTLDKMRGNWELSARSLLFLNYELGTLACRRRISCAAFLGMVFQGRLRFFRRDGFRKYRFRPATPLSFLRSGCKYPSTAVGGHRHTPLRLREGGWANPDPSSRSVRRPRRPPDLCAEVRRAGPSILKRLFQTVGPAPSKRSFVPRRQDLMPAARGFCTNRYSAGSLTCRPPPKSAYVPVVDPQQQYAAIEVTSTRHRVRNNLPSTPSFCPLVYVTDSLDAFSEARLGGRGAKGRR